MLISESIKNKRPVLFAAATILVIIFSYFALHTTPIGTYSDDLQYLLAARSIAGGHYANLYAPGESPVTNYHPGYPVTLALISKITGWNENFFRFITFVFLWGALALFYISVKKIPFSPLVFLFCGINPLLLWHSGDIMPDTMFMFLSYFIIFLVIDYNLEPYAFKPLFYISTFATIFSFYVRPTGLINIAFLLLFFIIHKRRKAALYSIFLFAAFTAPLFIYNSITAGNALHYLKFFHGTFSIGSILSVSAEFSRNIMFYLSMLCTKGLLYIPEQAGSLLRVFLSVLACACILLGLYSLKQNNSVKIIALWAFCYVIFHSFWVYADARYLFIILPIALFFFLHGIFTISKLTRYKTFLSSVLLLLIALSFVSADIQLFKVSYRNNKQNMYAYESKYEWIKNNIKGKTFLSFYAPRLFYYTGNQCYSMPLIKDPDLFYYELLQKNIDYIFITDVTSSIRTDTTELSHKTTINYVREFATNKSLGSNKRYELAHKDGNGTEIYKIIKDNSFRLNYGIEKRFNELLRIKNFSEASSFITLLNKYFPDSPVAQTGIALYYIQRNDTENGSFYFEKAYRISGDYLPCLYNYGIYCLKKGDAQKGISLISAARSKAFGLEDNEYLGYTANILQKLKS